MIDRNDKRATDLPPLVKGEDGAFHERVEMLSTAGCDKELPERTALELIAVMPQEAPCTDDDAPWRISTFELFRRKRAIEKQLEPIETALATASQNLHDNVHQKNVDAAAVNALLMRQWKKMSEPLDDSLDAIMRELERRGALPPTVTVSVMN